MFKWLFRLFLLLIIGGVGYLIYDYYRAGLHTRPDMPEGAFSLSFVGGPRVIVEGIPNEKSSRKYVVRRSKNIPTWFKDAWSYCKPPYEDEAKSILESFEMGAGLRLDAVCALDADGEIIPTALLFSAPKL